MKHTALAAVGVFVGIILLSFLATDLLAVKYESPTYTAEQAAIAKTDEAAAEAATPKEPDNRPVVNHVPLPKQVKAIYMTSCVAGTPSFRERLITLMEETEVNAVVIDIKDYSGTISFPPKSAAWLPAWQNARCGTADMRELVARLHEKGIFTIARVTVFQDPFYTMTRPDLAVKRADGVTVWKDNKGLSFIDVAAKDYWDHIVELSVEVYNLGFDEINYDYVRYPSDGPMTDISFPHSAASPYGSDKQANLEAFFKYLNEKLDDASLFAAYRHENTGRETATPWTSADLFGMTTTNYDDLSIGQVLERALPYFDFVAPMVYPSHYPQNYLGLGDPNDYPYKVVHHAMLSGVKRAAATRTPMNGFLHTKVATSSPVVYEKPTYPAAKLRTWIQDFDYGGDYDAVDVRNQIQASYDAGVMDWMIWAPSNNYTRGALLGPEAE